jgi:hypothetical protein
VGLRVLLWDDNVLYFLVLLALKSQLKAPEF